MNKLNKLYDLAEEKGYDIIDYDLNPIAQKGIVFKTNDKVSIVMDYSQINSHAEEAVIIAHEIGHVETNTLYKLNASQSEIARQEYRAAKWAVKTLIPFSDYFSALCQGIVEVWQLAEHFNVTEDFIIKTHYIYQLQGMI